MNGRERERESRNEYRILVGRTEGKRPPGRPRRSWADNIKMELREINLDHMDCSNLAQDKDEWKAFVSTVMGPPGFIKLCTVL
jgi:hypothetical protein